MARSLKGILVMGEMDAVIAEFLIESDENLGQVERDLVDMEDAPDQAILSSIFRAIHTIKGTCAFLGYTKLEGLAHTGETLLSRVRDGELTLTPDIISALLSMVDAIRQILECIEQGGTDGQEEYHGLRGRLTALQTGVVINDDPRELIDSRAFHPISGSLESMVLDADVPASESVAREDADIPASESVVREDADVPASESVVREDADVPASESVVREDADVPASESVVREDADVPASESVAREDADVPASESVVREDADVPASEFVVSETVESDPAMDEALGEFLIESDENLSQVERDLVGLNGIPDADILSSIFRAIHTIKGTCAFLGYPKLESLSHTGEALLGLLRDGELALTSSRTSALLAMVDAIRQILGNIERYKHDGTDDYTQLKAQLMALLTDDGSTVSLSRATTAASNPITSFPSFPSSSQADCTPVQPEPSIVSDAILPRTQECVDGVINSESTVQRQDIKGPSVAESSIRVDVSLLDKLMIMVGELVLTRNQILQCSETQESPSLLASSQRLSLITTELQEGIMKTRLQQIGNVWTKFPRVVRDLALSCGKEVRLEMEGMDTELDKTLIEAIKDPLTHLVRNSIDHGVELPDIRVQHGKARAGVLLLRAYHEGGQVNIEITDDGGGINVQQVAETAVKRGIVSQEQVARMQEHEILNLIFLPGFSTAVLVSNVSGRGVGMDVVKTNIEKIGGTIDVVTKVGEGTTFKLKIPLTLAIIPALIVRTGDERFAIPQVSLLELVRLEGDAIRTSIENIDGAPVCRLRGQLLSLIDLNQVLQLQSSLPCAVEGPDVINIVVLQAGGASFGLIVDEINDTEEIVVKPLSKQLKGISVLAGVTIMGDGRVALILDVMNLAKRVGVDNEGGEHTHTDRLCGNLEGTEHRKLLLLIQVGDSRQVAIPLGMVARLEEIPLSSLETSGGQEVIQYRQEILPVIRLSTVLTAYGHGSSTEGDMLQLVVISQGDRQVGLAVDRIMDIVEEEVTAQRKSTQPGILGSAIIQGRVTDFLDVQEIVGHCQLSPIDDAIQEMVGV